jgi:hypothetical protein
MNRDKDAGPLCRAAVTTATIRIAITIATKRRDIAESS